MKRQSGFTLVELVVVIMILGILAATALPRFMNVQDEAHTAHVDGVSGGLGTAIAMVHAQWMAEGGSGTGPVAGFGTGNVRTNATGWPVGTDGTFNDEDDCKAIWDNLMQNPPVADTSGTDIAGADWEATSDGSTCTYTYQADSAKVLGYDPSNGNMTVTN